MWVYVCTRHRGTNLSAAANPSVNFFYRLSARCLSGPLIPLFSCLLPTPSSCFCKLEKDEKGRRAGGGGGISSAKYGCTCFHIPISYVEYGGPKDEGEAA